MVLPIYPKPLCYEENTGVFSVPNPTFIKISAGVFSAARAEMLRDLWHRFCFTTANMILAEDEALPPFTLQIGNTDCTLAQEDDYVLCVTQYGVCIKGANENGLLHGFYTLLQMLFPVSPEEGKEQFCISCATVSDRPALRMRAFHFCLFPETTLELMEKTIRLAAFLKYTHFILEPWGALQLTCFPELAWKNHSYTKEEIKPLLLLAQDMGLEIVPMFNHLGHAAQSRIGMGRHTVLDQNPRLALLFEPDGWTWCLSNPKVHLLLRAVREELMELCGPGSFFHLGCDEAHSFATCPICRTRDGNQMLSDYLNGLSEELSQQERRGIIWGDQLLDASEWSSPFIASSFSGHQTHRTLQTLDRRLIIADWQYNVQKPDVPTSEHFQKTGFDVLLCPWDQPGNAAALHAAADRMKLSGVIDTAWHHMPYILKNLPEYADSAWQGANYEPGFTSATYCATLLRKLMPLQGRSFENSGFLPQETNPCYSPIL